VPRNVLGKMLTMHTPDGLGLARVRRDERATGALGR
jgi:hypothetical protein